MGYDDLLVHLGEFGRYQQFVCVLCVLACTPTGYFAVFGVFFLDAPEFRCAVPGLKNDTYKIQDKNHAALVNNTIPHDAVTGSYSKCSVYKYEEYGVNSVRYQNVTQTCDEWIYDKTLFESSIVSSLNFVCDREIYKSHADMMILTGNVAGSLLGGFLADALGRRKSFLILTIFEIVVAMSTAFVTTVPVLLVLRFAIACTSMGSFLSLFVLTSEIVGPNKRAFSGMATMLGWCLGMVILLVVAYFIRDWRTAQLVLACPSLFLLSYYWFLPESPRWLITKGRYKEAKEIINKMAKVNRAIVPQKLMKTEEVTPLHTAQTDEVAEMQKKGNVLDIIKSTTMLFRALVITFNWTSLNMVYYGITLNVDSLVEGDIFLNFLVMVSMEGSAYVLVMFMLDKIGRKVLYFSFVIIGGLGCLGTMGPVLAESDMIWINSVLSSVGKFGVTGAFAIFFIYTVELIPTAVRNSGLGMSSFIGRIAGITSPYIASLAGRTGGSIGHVVPLVIFGCMSVMAGLIALWLPETRGRKLPETIEELGFFTRKKKKRDSKSRRLSVATA